MSFSRTPQAALDDLAATTAYGALAELRHGDHVWRGTAGAARPGRFRAGSITDGADQATVALAPRPGNDLGHQIDDFLAAAFRRSWFGAA